MSDTGVPQTSAWFARKFIDEYTKAHNRPSEVQNKKSVIKTSLFPFFGDETLDRIGRARIDAYVAAKKNAGLSDKTIRNHLGVLGRMLRVAVE